MTGGGQRSEYARRHFYPEFRHFGVDVAVDRVEHHAHSMTSQSVILERKKDVVRSQFVCAGCNFRQHHTCIPVNAETEINCVTYRCTRRTDNNFYFYKIDPIYSASEFVLFILYSQQYEQYCLLCYVFICFCFKQKGRLMCLFM